MDGPLSFDETLRQPIRAPIVMVFNVRL